MTISLTTTLTITLTVTSNFPFWFLKNIKDKSQSSMKNLKQTNKQTNSTIFLLKLSFSRF